MMNKKSTIKLFVTFLIFIVTISIYSYHYTNLRNDFNDLRNSYETYKVDSSKYIDNLSSDIIELTKINENLRQNYSKLYQEKLVLNQTLGNLNKTHENLLNNYEKLMNSYQLITESLDETIEDIQKFEEDIEDSMAWFNDNSILTKDIKGASSILRILEDNCLDLDCELRTGCLFFVNIQKLDYEYQYDLDTSKELDKLQSLEEFIENKGGDCEDYSLFYKAQWNYLLDNCDIENHDVRVRTFTYQDSEEKYWLNEKNSWYMDGVTNIEYTGYNYPIIICGNIYDPVAMRRQGHCMIALTKEKVNSIDDLDKINGSLIIEPQNGAFQGFLGNESSYIYLIDESVNQLNYIYEIITDNDLFLYSFDEHQWFSYSGFLNDLNRKENALKVLN